MTAFEVGVCLPVMQYGPERVTPRWPEIRQIALHAEQMGMDTLWVPEELLWRSSESPARGFWDGISIVAAAAAVTSRIKIGSWVISALHRNPGIIAKTAETLDEISGGRFIFGLGAGHTGPGQAHAFGLPEDQVAARFEDALQIIVPLMRTGRADFDGIFHSAHDLVQQPIGPRPNAIPLLIGGQKPRGMRLAAQHGDIWSTYVEKSSGLDEFGPRIEQFRTVCDELSRDFEGYGRAAGLEVAPLQAGVSQDGVISGSPNEIADRLRTFREAGYTQVDLMVNPGTAADFDALAPVVEMLKGD